MNKLDEWGVPPYVFHNMYWMGQMPPRLPLELKLDESLAIFKNELLAVGLLTPEKDWYDFKYTETSEKETIADLDDLLHVFTPYDEDGTNKGESYNASGKLVAKPVVINPELFKRFPTVFPLQKGKDIYADINVLMMKGNSNLVYRGQVFKDLFLEHNLTPERITTESYEAFIQFLMKSLIWLPDYHFMKATFSQTNLREHIQSHFYQSCYVHYAMNIRNWDGAFTLLPAAQMATSTTILEKFGKLTPLYKTEQRASEVEGFPQGSPISPILCSAILGDSVFKMGKCVMYADDGLFYGNLKGFELEPNQEMRTANLSFAKEKSSWVKRDGVWLHPLKFLGLTYTGTPNLTDSPESLVGSTKDKIVWDKELAQNVVRYGSKLPFDKQSMVLDYVEAHDPRDVSPFQTVVKDYDGLEPYLEKLTEIRSATKVTASPEASPEASPALSTKSGISEVLEFYQSFIKDKVTASPEASPEASPGLSFIKDSDGLEPNLEASPGLSADLRLGVLYNNISKDEKSRMSEGLIEFFKQCLYHLYLRELQLHRIICTKEEAQKPPALRFGYNSPYNSSNYTELLLKGHMELLHVLFESLWNTYILTGTAHYTHLSARLISLKTALLFSTLGSIPSLHAKELTFFKHGWLNRTDKFVIDSNSVTTRIGLCRMGSEVRELHTELNIALAPKSLSRLLNPLLKPNHKFAFTWELMLDSGLFGFIQSRLYGGSWNSTFPQDFKIKYSPRSWMWYKQILLKSPFTVLVYGKEDIHGVYEKLGKPEFMKILAEQDKNQGRSSSLTIGEKLRVKAISIRNYRERNVPLSGKVASMLAHPELTVFNSPSLAFSSLVSLFSTANKFDSYIEAYESHHKVTLNPHSKRIVKSYLSLGYADRLLFLTPELLPELPNFGKFDSDFEYLKDEVQAISVTRSGGEAFIPAEIIEGYDASPDDGFPSGVPPMSLLTKLSQVRKDLRSLKLQEHQLSRRSRTSLPPIVSSAK